MTSEKAVVEICLGRRLVREGSVRERRRLGVDDMRPRDVVFGYERPLGWIQSMYPEVGRLFRGDGNVNDDHPIEIIEYIDEEEQVLIAQRGPISSGKFPSTGDDRSNVIAELERAPNILFFVTQEL